MIKLKSDFVSIEIPEKNPVYSILKRFVGELLLVQEVDDQPKEKTNREMAANKPAVVTSPTEPVSVNIYKYLESLDKVFINENSLVKKILKNHTIRFLGAQEGSKTGNYAALSPFSSEGYVTCVRVIDGSVSYITVPRELVSPI